MSGTRQNLFTRDDTFFGVCEALGEDLRIPANLFRLALAPLLIWDPVTTLCGYLIVGCFIAITRFVFPNPRTRAAAGEGHAQIAAPPREELAAAA